MVRKALIKNRETGIAWVVRFIIDLQGAVCDIALVDVPGGLQSQYIRQENRLYRAVRGAIERRQEIWSKSGCQTVTGLGGEATYRHNEDHPVELGRRGGYVLDFMKDADSRDEADSVCIEYEEIKRK